jgi:hypothetical protein
MSRVRALVDWREWRQMLVDVQCRLSAKLSLRRRLVFGEALLMLCWMRMLAKLGKQLVRRIWLPLRRKLY